MIKNYIKVTLRYFLKQKTFTVINIFGLTFGLVCFIFMAVWVWDEYSFDRFHENKDNVYQIFAEKDRSGESVIVPYASSSLVPLIKGEVPEVKTIARAFPAHAVFAKETMSVSEQGVYADSALLQIFSFPLKEGSLDNAFKETRSIVISTEMAEKYFPGQSALGEYIDIVQEEKQPYKITGVLKKIPYQSSLRFDFILPYQHFEDTQRPWWKSSNKYSFSNFNVHVFIETVPGIRRADIDKKLTAVLTRHSIAETDDALFAYPFVDVYLRNDFSAGRNASGRIVYLRLISAVAFIVLIIACINFINLYTVMASKRHKEVGLRKAVGAQRRQVTFQFLTGSVLVAVISMLLAITLIEMLMPFFNALTSKHIALPYSSPLFIIVLIAGSISIGFLAGIYPALLFSSFSLLSEKQKLNIGGGLTGLRKFLVVFQFTLSIAFIVFTSVVFNQIEFIHNSDLGIKTTQILRHVLHGIRGKQQLYKEELLSIPGIQSVSFTEQDPLNTMNKNKGVLWPGKPEDNNTFFNVIQVSQDFIETFEVGLVEGRAFDKVYSSKLNSLKQVILNEEAAKSLGLDQPMGTELTVWGNKALVVGIAKNYHHQPLTQRIEPVVILCNPEETWNAYISYDQAYTKEILDKVQRVYKKYEDQYPFDYTYIQSDYRSNYASLQTVGWLSSIFTMAAIFISALGLFGLSAFLMQQRTKETGVRKVLGANVASLLYLFSKDFLKLVIISIVIALPLAWIYTDNWLSDYAYHFELEPAPFVFAGIIAIVIALASVVFNTLKASMINPAKTLKEE
ncbi:ABC transporter permease [Fulvivirga sp. 29W222]|uniref:ABC transporter permease n=1 Tax=Fulvivirga marina TaxID=2494733 RepID=A0A937KBF8_9BACT|nr:ABC transporter permease [Fulvivirga marina]MBL6446072.1 ABC transporter permease [Fulvivirga marina]